MARITIEDKLYQDIKDYCDLNELKTSAFISNLLSEAFLKEKYGTAPPFFKPKQEEVVETPKETPKEEPVVEEKKEEPIEKNDTQTYKIQYL